MGSNPIQFQPGNNLNERQVRRHQQQMREEQARQDKYSQKLENLILEPGANSSTPGMFGPGGAVVDSAVGGPITKSVYKHDMKKLLRKMKRHHMDLNQPGPSGLTPLQLAGASNNSTAGKELLKAGAEQIPLNHGLNYLS